MARDYIQEMNGLLVALIDAPGDLICPVAARELVERLRRTDLDLLSGWLDACAETLVTDTLGGLNRRRRSSQNRNARAAQFGRDAANGVFGAYRLRFEVADGGQRFLADMTGEDCAWAAARYLNGAEQLERRAVFFESLSAAIRQAQAARVAEVYTDEQLTQLWRQATDNPTRRSPARP
jgi:hypothetical protein